MPSAQCCAGKAGADVLFVDPERKSTTVGVTVSPIRIASLAQFGDVAAVGKRLLGAERAKVRAKMRVQDKGLGHTAAVRGRRLLGAERAKVGRSRSRYKGRGGEICLRWLVVPNSRV